tara:strand:+ start:54 stop:221 length:168 start_codon:yes stop_codon:yes gene_type:complete
MQNVEYMLGDNHIVSIIFFTKEKFSKDIASRFIPLINSFKTSTVKLVSQQRIFSD